MDIAKFYSWRRAKAIVELSKGPHLNEYTVRGKSIVTCQKVYDGLLEEGLVRFHRGKYELTGFGKRQVPLAKRTQTRLLNELVQENQKLVRKLVNQYYVRTMSFSEEEDLFQAGLLAFMMALNKFDPEKYSDKGTGASFPTYLGTWVRSYTKRDTATQQTIICPEGFGMPYSVHKKAEEIMALTGKVATAEELGTYKVRVKGKTKEVKVTDELLLSWKAAQNSVVSLDNSQDHNVLTGESQLSGYVGGAMSAASLASPPSSQTPEALYLTSEREKEMVAIQEQCTDSERNVISAIRNGEGSDRLIGKMLGLTEQGARTYKGKLIAKLSKLADARR